MDAREKFRNDFDVPRETMDRFDAFAELLRAENAVQNLVSEASLDDVWSRHMADSAQLLALAPLPNASWLDLGTGAGFPGLIVAALHAGPVTLVEERRRRVEFLVRAVEVLGLKGRVAIHAGKLERFESQPFDVISARAFAPLERLLALSHSFSTVKTRFILPKGRNAPAELEAASASWHGDFRLEKSRTSDDAWIIVGEGVAPKGKRGKGKGAA